MRFLIDADLPRRAVHLLASYGHVGIDVRDIGMRRAPDPQIAVHAQQNGLCLITCDFGFADIRNYPPGDYHGLIVLQLPRDADSELKLARIKSVLDQPTVLTQIPGRLAIVQQNRIRLRPKP